MHFQQFYLTCLSHASYMLGADGLAAVVDPQRDVGIYLEEADRCGLRIAYVIETHMHRDFVSGHRELAALTGAQIWLSHAAGAKFPHVAVREGENLAFGACRLRFLETPGHSIDSICVVVTDLERSAEPFAVLTGDTLFIGDVGRPDLSRSHTPEELAALLYRSLHDKLMKLPDHVEIWPAHGAGSLCGRQLSSEKKSTIGRERATNYALRAATMDEFVQLVTADQPERPAYFAADAEINREGALPLSALPPLAALPPYEVLHRQREGALVLDTRPPLQFGAAHVPGSLNIGLAGQYASWAGTLIPLDTQVILVAEDRERVEESRVRLARVGMENVAGHLEDGLAAWVRDGLPAGETPQVAVAELHALLADDSDHLQVVDVRRAVEWAEGYIRGAKRKPLDKLSRSLDDLDPRRPVATYCKGGYRSSIASSLLRREGFREVYNVTGGFDAWRGAGLPLGAGVE
jgi:hydroxyacylglutathione hydrolase